MHQIKVLPYIKNAAGADLSNKCTISDAADITFNSCIKCGANLRIGNYRASLLLHCMPATGF